jgi:arginyl-tRNA synthetase
MDEDPVVQNARLALTDASRLVIKVGLNLLGIKAPERM